MVTAVELVRRGAARHGDRRAVIFGFESLTFREVDESASRLANVLIEHGLNKGDRLGMLLGNSLWSIALDFACLKAGIVRVPLNARLAVTEHARMLQGTGTMRLLHAAELSSPAEELLQRVPGLTAIGLGGPGAGGGADLLRESQDASPADPFVPVEESDPVLLLHTSGTTGVLKAATHTQGSWAEIATNVLLNLVSPQPDSMMLHAASLIHASGTFVLPYWVRGATSLVMTGFEPDSFLDAIARHRVTEINLVPTMLGMLFTHEGLADADLSSLETVIYGASPMPRPLIERAIAEWGPIFRQYYGQTEAPLGITVLGADDHLDPELKGSCGYPSLDMDVRLADEDGNPSKLGSIGEVQVRARSQMAGYHEAAELNADTITPDGYIRTRDLAYVNERGYYFLVDRRSDMIVTGGYNVYPREVEDALATHPAVAECAVVGAPDPTWVEAVTAFVTVKPGAEVTEAELKEVVRCQLAGYKVPKTIRFVEDIPKSAVGKILRRALREPLWTDQR